MNIKRKVYRVLSIILLMITLLTSINPLIVSAKDPRGNAPGGATGKGGAAMNPGVIFGITKIPNTAVGEGTKQKPDGSWLSEVDKTLSKEDRLYYFPQNMFNAQTVNDHGLIEIYESGKSGGAKGKTNYYIHGHESWSFIEDNWIYKVDKSSERPDAAFNHLIADKLVGDSEYAKKFKAGTMTKGELQTLVNESKGKLPAAIESFRKLFADTGNLSVNYGKAVWINDKDKHAANYFDLLVIVNEMTGGKHWDDLEQFIKNKNADGQPEFVVVELLSVFALRDEAQTYRKWYSYPTWMANQTGYAPDNFGHTNHRKGKNQDYKTSDKKTWWTADQQADTQGGKIKSIDGTLDYNDMFAWYLGGKGTGHMARYILMPSNEEGLLVGASGYTYFANGYIQKPFGPKMDVFLAAEPNQPIYVDKGESVVATIDVSLKTAKDKTKDIKDTFDGMTQIDPNKKPTLTLKLSRDVMKGTGMSAKAFDTCNAPAVQPGMTWNGTDTITWANIPDYAALEPWLNGDKKITLTDTDIIINEDTENKYSITGTLDWNYINPTGNVPVKCDLNSVGRDPRSVPGKIAFDYAKWALNPDPPITEEAHYYSVPETPYVEIKEGSPGKEKFEAMAGVPTTEDLYVGFGATEFMINMDVENKKSGGTRKYTLTFTASQCTEVNANCVISTTTHSHSHQTGTDSEGNPIMSSFSWSCGGACGFCGGTDCPGDTHACNNKVGAVGIGCQVNQQINESHPHSHTFTGVITQPIQEFNYTNIKGLELWQVNRLIYEGNDELFKNPNQVIDPKTGYKAFFNQEAYKSNNGRLMFSFNFNEAQKYGDTNVAKSDGTKQLKVDCDRDATDWMNSMVQGKTTNTKVISDYVVLTTTEGYQVPMYHTYDSNTVPIHSGSFSTGSDTKSLGAPTITFSKIPTWAEMWENNPTSSAKWDDETHITRSGYNGKYSQPSVKWNNTNIVISADPSVNITAQPNVKQKVGSKSFAKNFNNLRMTYVGLDIIDSTDSNRNWSASDGIEPVHNAFYDTGECSLEADKEISFEKTGGINFSNAGNMHKRAVTYSDSHNKVNDIVVHNPVSVQYATVITNDKKYDLRTEESLAFGADSPSPFDQVCPRDASCQFSKLTCKIPASLHTAACYTTINTGTKHIGGLNAHVHTSDCNSGGGYTFYHPSGCTYAGETHTSTDKDRCSVCGHSCGGPGVSSGGIETSTQTKVGFAYAGNAAGTDFYTFTATGNGTVSFYSTEYSRDPRGRVYINGSLIIDNDDGGSGLNFDCGTVAFKKGDTIRLNVYQYGSSGSGTATVIAKINQEKAACTNKPNTHVCTSACITTTAKVLICDNPHHHEAGQPWDYNNAKNHYDFGDTRCYTPCGNDDNHKTNGPVKLPDGSTAITNDLFINIDREFQVYYPNMGDFAQSPSLHGISEVTSVRGMGYVDAMDTTKWTREKYLYLPVNVIAPDGLPYSAGEPIDMFEQPHENYYYTFYVVLGNSEKVNARVEYLAIANNAAEIKLYSENEENTNRLRRSDFRAKHTAAKTQVIDVVGYIGALTLNDTGDFRFATLFKQIDNNNKGWLIENLVPRVNYKLPKTIVADTIDVRQETASPSTNWHSPYSMTEAVTGGKAFPYVKLPLTPALNPIKALQNQPLRPGYKLYMDIETVGNYYGENVDENGVALDTDLYFKTQITPRYWELNLDTGLYTPVDVYMGTRGEYRPVVKFGDSDTVSEWIYYLDWLEESARRNYTSKERAMSNQVADEYSYPINIEGEAEIMKRTRLPIQQPDPIGTANRLFLNDINRTFIGSTTTYGKDKNPYDYWEETYFGKQSQRWQFTLGLPSSSVFVKAGLPCTEANIAAIQNNNSVIVCAIDIKSRGEIWTLEYDGTNVNSGGFKVTPNGKTYSPPIDPNTGKTLKDPIVAVYSNKYTAKDDLRTEGSH